MYFYKVFLLLFVVKLFTTVGQRPDYGSKGISVNFRKILLLVELSARLYSMLSPNRLLDVGSKQILLFFSNSNQYVNVRVRRI